MSKARSSILIPASVAALGSLATELLVAAPPVLARDLRGNAGAIQLVIPDRPRQQPVLASRRALSGNLA